MQGAWQFAASSEDEDEDEDNVEEPGRRLWK